MSLDVKKNKSPSSARKSLFGTQTLAETLFPEFPAYYPDLRTLHDDDALVQSFERDYLYPRDDQCRGPSTDAAPVDRQDVHRLLFARMVAPCWELKMNTAADQYDKQSTAVDKPRDAPLDAQIPEELASLFGQLFGHHELLVREALREQSTETFCEGIATEIVEHAASQYAARRLDAIQNAYTACATWDALRYAVASSFLPCDKLGAFDDTGPRRGLPTGTPCTDWYSAPASIRATMTVGELVARSRRPPSALPVTPQSTTSGGAGACTVLSPGSPPSPVPIDHFCRYVVEQALARGAGGALSDTVEGDDGVALQPRAVASGAANARGSGARHTGKAATQASSGRTASAGQPSATLPAAPGEPSTNARRTGRAKPMAARQPTPPPPRLVTSSPGTGVAAHGDVTGAASRLATQDDLSLALRKAGAATPATVASAMSATAPAGTSAQGSFAASPLSATGGRTSASVAGKKDTLAVQRRKPLQRIVGADAFPAHEVERERSKLHSRRTVAKTGAETATPQSTALPTGDSTVYHLKVVEPAADDAESPVEAAPSGAVLGVGDTAAAAEVFRYMSADAKRAAQIKEKQRLRRAEEDREHRFVDIADGEATRALLEHQLDVRPQPGVTLKQSERDRNMASKRPGARSARHQDEAAVVADGGEYVIPDGKKTWSESFGTKAKMTARTKDGSRVGPAAPKKPSR